MFNSVQPNPPTTPSRFPCQQTTCIHAIVRCNSIHHHTFSRFPHLHHPQTCFARPNNIAHTSLYIVTIRLIPQPNPFLPSRPRTHLNPLPSRSPHLYSRFSLNPQSRIYLYNFSVISFCTTRTSTYVPDMPQLDHSQKWPVPHSENRSHMGKLPYN
jgi:hypothetical protein